MKYDFTSILERHGKDAIAVDGLGTMPGMAPDRPREGFDVIPMWVADMNFPTVPTIQQEIIERAQHPAFGYFSPTEEYYDSIIDWQRRRNGVDDIKAEYLGYENGVLGGVVSALNVLCSRGDKVLLHSPTYIGFTMSLRNNGYDIVHSPLKQDGQGIWRMDLEDMEDKIVSNNIHVMIFCSPHNPTGRVWEKDEMTRMMKMLEKHEVYVICDEIWSDLILRGNRHIPLHTVSEYARMHTVTLYAPSKTFNLAGLVGSYHLIYNRILRERIAKESSLCHYNEMNVLSMHALIGAYREEGHEWLDELREVLSDNVDMAYDYFSNIEGITLSKPQGTYMLFLDCEGWCKAHNCEVDVLLKKGWDVGVAWQDGRPFHGPYAIRVNLASPASRIQEALERLGRYVFN